MFRAIGRFLFVFIILPILFVITAGYLRGDDKPDPVVNAFYQEGQKNYAQDNGAIAMLGLVAPADASDSYGWALNLVNAQLEKYKAFEEKYAGRNDWGFLNAMLEGNTEVGIAAYISGWDDIPNKLAFKGDTKTIACAGAQWTYPPSNMPCNLSAVDAMVKDNAQLMARYEAALKYPRYVELSLMAGPKAQTLIKMQELYTAHLIRLSETDKQAAIQKWMANMGFYKRALAGDSSLIGRSVLMVNYGLIQRALPAILAGDHAAAQRYQSEMLAVLAPFGAKDCHIEQSMKVEYQIMGPIIDRLGNFQRHKFYRFQQDFITAWNTPAPQAPFQWQKFSDRYVIEGAGDILHWEDWHAPASGMVANMIIGGMAVGGDLAQAMHAADARSRILNLYVQALASAAAPQEIPALISSSPEAFYNPFTAAPFAYDEKEQLVYFTTPSGIKQGLPFTFAKAGK